MSYSSDALSGTGRVNFTVSHGACDGPDRFALGAALSENATLFLPYMPSSRWSETNVRHNVSYTTVYATCSPMQCVPFATAWGENVMDPFVKTVALEANTTCTNATLFGVGVPIPDASFEDIFGFDSTACTVAVTNALMLTQRMSDAACGTCFDELGSCPTTFLQLSDRPVPLTSCTASTSADTLCEFTGAWKFATIIAVSAIVAIILVALAIVWIYERRKKRADAAADRAAGAETTAVVTKADAGVSVRLRA